MMNKTGVPTKKQTMEQFPDKNSLKKAKAILECYEDIPCNPCSTSCPFDAIEIGEDINDQPILHVDKCTGCGICISSCPGLAIIVAQVKEGKAWFKVPYEFVPLPKKGESWQGVNRAGEVICEAKIEQVLLGKKQNKTAVVGVSVDEEHLYDFITIRGKYE